MKEDAATALRRLPGLFGWREPATGRWLHGERSALQREIGVSAAGYSCVSSNFICC